MVAPSPDSTFNQIRARLRSPGHRFRRGAHGTDRVLLTAAAVVGVGVLGFSILRSSGREAQPVAAVDVAPAASDEAEAPPDTQGITEQAPAPVPAPMRVHVAGAVAHPGVYALPSGSIGDEAVAAAGGALAEADLGRVNLAGKLADGQQFYLPRKGEAVPEAAGGDGTGSGSAGAGAPVNLNTASTADLDELPGIGTATAQKIVDHRSKHGPFTDVRQLLDVPGIGEGKLAALEGLVAV